MRKILDDGKPWEMWLMRVCSGWGGARVADDTEIH